MDAEATVAALRPNTLASDRTISTITIVGSGGKYGSSLRFCSHYEVEEEV
jgi:hypothetical protein